MKRSQKTLIWLPVVLVAGAALYFLVIKKGSSEPKPSDGTTPDRPAAAAPSTGGQEAMPLPVKAVQAVKGDVIIRLKSPGEAFTERLIAVKAEVGGPVRKLLVSEGRQVAKDDVLLTLDDREYRLSLHKLEALRLKNMSEVVLEKMFASSETAPSADMTDRIVKAKTAFESADAAYRKGLSSQEEWEKARRAYEFALIESGGRKEDIISSSLTQTEDDVRLAELNLERTVVRAPFAGITTNIKVAPGEHISAGQELFTLVDISSLKVRAGVLESEVGKMKTGREVDISFPAYPGRIFKGTVEAVSPVVKAEDRTCSVYIGLLDPGREIKPGMHAEVSIAAEVYPDRLIVPQEAILVRNGRKLVFVVEDGLAKWRYVETGVENEAIAEIVDGVKEGETVITDGHFTLAHDARVSVVK